MLWLGRCFLSDCKANLPNEDYQRIAAEFGLIWCCLLYTSSTAAAMFLPTAVSVVWLIVAVGNWIHNWKNV